MDELGKYTILPEFRDWAVEIIRKSNDTEVEQRAKIYEAQQSALLGTQKELDNLTKMRYRDLITDEEFTKEKTELQNKIIELRKNVDQTEDRADHWLDLTEWTFNFAANAREAFEHGSVQDKKEILMALCSNFVQESAAKNS